MVTSTEDSFISSEKLKRRVGSAIQGRRKHPAGPLLTCSQDYFLGHCPSWLVDLTFLRPSSSRMDPHAVSRQSCSDMKNCCTLLVGTAMGHYHPQALNHRKVKEAPAYFPHESPSTHTLVSSCDANGTHHGCSYVFAVEPDHDGPNPHMHGTCRKGTNRRVREDEAHLPVAGKKWGDDV